MRLVYTATGKPVNIGDRHTIGGFALVVARTPQPHKPDSEGKIDFYLLGGVMGPLYYASVIGAEWIDREDRAHENGYESGVEGVPYKNPYVEGSDSHAGFLAGHEHGMQVRREVQA